MTSSGSLSGFSLLADKRPLLAPGSQPHRVRGRGIREPAWVTEASWSLRRRRGPVWRRHTPRTAPRGQGARPEPPAFDGTAGARQTRANADEFGDPLRQERGSPYWLSGSWRGPDRSPRSQHGVQYLDRPRRRTALESLRSSLGVIQPTDSVRPERYWALGSTRQRIGTDDRVLDARRGGGARFGRVAAYFAVRRGTRGLDCHVVQCNLSGANFGPGTHALFRPGGSRHGLSVGMAARRHRALRGCGDRPRLPRRSRRRCRIDRPEPRP